MNVRVMTPEKNIFDSEVESVQIPGVEEEFSLMDFHQPALIRLARGTLHLYFRKDGSLTSLAIPIRRGVARVGTQITLLVEER